MIKKFCQLSVCIWVSLLASCYPPQVQYPYTKLVTSRRLELKDNLLLLLPKEQQTEPAAQEEATWLADTAYKASAGIARVNGSYFPGWAGNAFVNSHLQDRGLCWHYQHDLFRELRRRPLNYFRIGCCVRDRARASEHNCVYIAPKDAEWPLAWVLDPWMWNGRLKVDDARKLNPKKWGDLPSISRVQAAYYPEGHQWSIEHWSILRGEDGMYDSFRSPATWSSPQYRRMYNNVQKGMIEHPGRLTNY